MARKIAPYVWYTRQELRKLMKEADAADLKMRGYVLQFDVDKMKYRVVSYKDAADGTSQGVGTFTPPPAIKKRTEQQRLDSMVLNLVEGMREAGGIATLQSGVAPRVSLGDGTSRPATTAEKDAAKKAQKLEEEQNERRVKEIVGEAWKQGKTEITAEVVRQVCAGLLARSEREHEAKLAKQITRHED